MSMMKKKVVAVVGPTASGKSHMAVNIALEFGGEVVSADSMQIYSELSVGTAKPTLEEMNGVRHYLVGHKSIYDEYSVADFVSDAGKCIDDITSDGKLPIVCGGTGLYSESLLSGISFTEIESSEEIREKYRKIADEKGNDFVHGILEGIDPDSACKIHQNNVGRVIRALEVYDLTGKTMTQLQKESRSSPSPYDVLYIGLNFRDRSLLYERCDRRVDEMMAGGLLEEARMLYETKGAVTAAQAIGYKEFYPYFDRTDTLEHAVETVKKETRNYAKRQLTWFNRNKDINWYFLDDDDVGSLTGEIYKKVAEWRANEEK